MFCYGYVLEDGVGGERVIEVCERRLREILKPLIMGIDVDEDWYLLVNQDVKRAVQEGVFASAKDHYVVSGYFENRPPRHFVVDEAWYLATYSDVRDNLNVKLFSSAQQHFDEYGFREARLPFSGWRL